jgi:hypothetical protein
MINMDMERLFERLKGKTIDQYTIEELEEKMVYNKIMFYCYAIGAIVMIMAGSYTIWGILNTITGLETTGGTALLLMLGIFGVINFFLLFWVWMTNESSYYKMEQRFYELSIYLRSMEYKEK